METYGELKTEVARILDRSDVDAEIPRYIRAAEDKLQGIEIDDNEFVVTYTNAGWTMQGFSQQALFDGVAHQLPQNFDHFSLVTWNGYPLTHVSKQQLVDRILHAWDTVPRAFCLSAQRVMFSAALDTDPSTWADDDVLEFTYYGRESLDSVPAWQVALNPVDDPAVEDTSPSGLLQTDDNTTRMLQRQPELLLHGALYYGKLALEDDAGAAKYKALFEERVDELKSAHKRNRYSGSTSQVTSAY